MTRASFSRRSLAFLIDCAIALALCAAGSVGVFLAAAYLVLRDGLLGGRSIGKRLLSLSVVERASGSGVGLVGSLKRNIVFAVPLLNAAASVMVFEGVIAYFDEEGLRLGDRIAGTRVVRS